MGPLSSSRLFVTVVVLLLASCAPPPSQSISSNASEPPRPATPKKITAAIVADTKTLAAALAGIGTRGVNETEEIINSGLTGLDKDALRIALLSEAAPSTGNGLWKVFPDGRMETTWKIRANTVWHDGAPFTSEDLLFTARIAQDKELPEFSSAAYNSVESIEAPDASTVFVRWKQPYINADGLFDGRPRPRHLLGDAYLNNKASFRNLPYWTTDYVGTGAFKVREYVQSSHVLLEANDRYVLGRPKLDLLEIRIIPDQNTLVANILAGEITATIGKTISAEQALEVVRRMPGERIENKPANFISVNPQFVDPSQPLILNVDFRRALTYAMNRQELVDSLLGGQGPGVAHTWAIPRNPEYAAVEARIPRYDYDPRKAAQMIEALGYVKAPGGSGGSGPLTAGDGFYRNARAEQLSVHLRTYQVDADVKSQLAVADDWQRLGVKNDQEVMSPQVSSNNQYVYTFPGFLIQRSWGSALEFTAFYSYNVPLPSNNYRSGYSGRYQSAELDALIDKYYATIPLTERARAAEQVLYHIADILVLMPLFYDIDPHIIDARLVNMYGSAQSNAHEWDLRI